MPRKVSLASVTARSKGPYFCLCTTYTLFYNCIYKDAHRENKRISLTEKSSSESSALASHILLTELSLAQALSAGRSNPVFLPAAVASCCLCAWDTYESMPTTL